MTINRSKYKLAICELFNPYFHGFDYRSDNTIQSHFLMFETINRDSFFNNDYKISIRYLLSIYKTILSNTRNDTDVAIHLSLNHPIVENYANIVRKRSYYTIDIVETDILTGQEMVAYKKTFWIKILQRRWKTRYYRKINSLKNPRRLFLRQINGR